MITYAIQPLIKPEKLLDSRATARNEKEDYSIFSTALRTVVINVSDNSSGPSLVLILLPYLLDVIQKYRSVDDIDILISLIERFGSSFTDDQVNKTEAGLIEILQNQTGLIQKRAIIALGKLTRYLQGDAYVNLLAFITKNFPAAGSGLPIQSTKNIIILASTVIKADSSKAKQYLNEIVPQLISTLHIELLEDEYANESVDLAEVREASLTALETIISEFDSQTITSFLEQFIAVAKAFLRFDPNFVGDDEEQTEEESIFASNGTTDDVDMDEEDDEEEEEEGDDDDDFDEDNGFSDDDDDQTWKLRRLSAKIIGGLVNAAPMSLSSIYSETFKPIVVSCIKEREDSVKVTSLETFSILVEAASSDRYFYATRQTFNNKRKSSDANVSYTTDPQTLLGDSLPVIIKNFIELLNNKDSSKNVKHSLLATIKSLNDVVRFSVKDLSLTINAITAVASIRGSPYMSDVLQIVGSILTRNNTSNLDTLLQKLVEIIVNGISDSYYRISGEALDTVLCLFPHYIPSSSRSGNNNSGSNNGNNGGGQLPTIDTSQLQVALITKVGGNSFDIDIRKKAIKALAVLLQRVPSTSEQVTAAVNAISSQLDNELLRYEALNAIKTFTSVETSGSNPIAASVPLAFWLPNITHLSTQWAAKTLNQIIVFLRQSLFLIRSESLHDMRLLSQLVSLRILNKEAKEEEVSEFGKFIHALLDKVFTSIDELKKTTTLENKVKSEIESVGQFATIGAQESSISDLEFQLSSEIRLFAESFDGLVLLGPSLLSSIVEVSTRLFSSTESASIESALLALFDKYTRSLPSDKVAGFYKGLSSGSGSLVSSVIGLTIVNCGLDSEIAQFSGEIEQQAALASPDIATTEKALQVLGYVGRHKELDICLDSIYSLLNNEALRTSVASTVGKVTIGGLSKYLDELLQHLVNVKEQGKQYFYLLSLKSVVVYLQTSAEQYKKDATTPGSPSPGVGGSSSNVATAEISNFPQAIYVDTIWKTLFSIGFEDDRAQGGEKAIVAECIGRLSIIDPDKYLPELKSQLASPKVSVRRSVVSAVKYTFGQTHEQYDRLLRPMIVDFLVLMEDENLSIRQVALSTLMSAIRNKPLLLLPHLSRLLPLLYKETHKDSSLVRIVQMGPFKHEVDDGLELRKSAYEAMYTLITALPYEWQASLVRDETFADRAFAGLEDDHDIRVLSCVTLGRMVAIDIRFLTQRGGSSSSTTGAASSGGGGGGDGATKETNLERIISGFSEILDTQVKANAVKQEFESQGELVRNVLRVTQSINESIDAAGLGVSGKVGGIGSGTTGGSGFGNVGSSGNGNLLKTLSTASLNTVNNLTAGTYGGGSGVGTSTPGTPVPGGGSSTGGVTTAAASAKGGSGLSDGDLVAWMHFQDKLENGAFKGMQ